MDAKIYSQLVKNIELQFKAPRVKQGQYKGLVVALSRGYGTGIRDVAKHLVRKLNAQQIGYDLHPKPWILIDTNVIKDLSIKLKLESSIIEHYIPLEKKSFFEQVIHSFGPDYNKLDTQLTESLKAIMHSYFKRGNVVILGKGGCHFAEELDNALKVRINSSLEYRISKVIQNHNLGYSEAKEKVLYCSKLREDFLEHISKGKEIIYDTEIDRSRLSDETLSDYLLSFTNAKLRDVKRHITKKVEA